VGVTVIWALRWQPRATRGAYRGIPPVSGVRKDFGPRVHILLLLHCNLSVDEEDTLGHASFAVTLHGTHSRAGKVVQPCGVMRRDFSAGEQVQISYYGVLQYLKEMSYFASRLL
jgi:hypothetical protein